MTTIEITTVAPPAVRARPQWLIVHYRRDDADYDDWSLHAWGDIAPGAGDRLSRTGTRSPARTPTAGSPGCGSPSGARDVGFLSSTATGPRTSPTTGTSTRPSPRRSGCAPATRWCYPERRAGAARPCPTRHRRPPLPPARRRLRRLGPARLGGHARRRPDWSAPLAPGPVRRVRRGVPGAGPAGRRRPALRAAPRRRQGPARRPAPRPHRRAARCGCSPARPRPYARDLRSLGPRARPGPRAGGLRRPHHRRPARPARRPGRPASRWSRPPTAACAASATSWPASTPRCRSRRGPAACSRRRAGASRTCGPTGRSPCRELGDAALGDLLRGQLLVVGRDDDGRITDRSPRCSCPACSTTSTPTPPTPSWA